MRYSLYSVVVVLALAGCQKEDLAPIPSQAPQSGGDITADQLFTNQDKGEKISLRRQSKETARAAVDSYSYVGNYGYGYQNPFLAFADYLHWLDASVTSVVRLRFGQDPNLQTLVATKTCWNFVISSSHRLSIQRIDQRVTAGTGSMTSTSTNEITVNWAVDSALGGVIFAIHSTDDYSPFDNGYNPYHYGYDGYNNGWYYFYPPPSQSFPWQPKTLRVKGTAFSCVVENALAVSPPAFDIDLSSELNQYPGTMPSFTKAPAPGQVMTGRIINFDGQDWWY